MKKMKQTQKVRLSVDLAMIILLPLQMAYSLIGEEIHEYLGSVMFILFILHHLFNRAWWRNLFKGRYTPVRSLSTAVNLLLVLFMIMQPLCGIVMSRYAFSSLNLEGITSYARTVHLLAAYWGYVLMSFHVGLHGKMLLGRVNASKASKASILAPRGAAMCLSAYGVYAFIRRGFAGYMFGKTQFVFFDFSEPFICFLSDYIAIMFLSASAGYYLSRLLQVRK